MARVQCICNRLAQQLHFLSIIRLTEAGGAGPGAEAEASFTMCSDSWLPNRVTEADALVQEWHMPGYAHLQLQDIRFSVSCLQHRLIEADALVEERRRELREAERAAEEVARALEVARSVQGCLLVLPL